MLAAGEIDPQVADFSDANNSTDEQGIGEYLDIGIFLGGIGDILRTEVLKTCELL